jgi:hypothetical protein
VREEGAECVVCRSLCALLGMLFLELTYKYVSAVRVKCCVGVRLIQNLWSFGDCGLVSFGSFLCDMMKGEVSVALSVVIARRSAGS